MRRMSTLRLRRATLLGACLAGCLPATAPATPTWQQDAQAAPGSALACGAGSGSVTPAVGPAQVLFDAASPTEEGRRLKVRVPLSAAEPDACGTRAQVEVIPPPSAYFENGTGAATCGTQRDGNPSCTVTTRPGEFGGTIVEDARAGASAPFPVGAPGAPFHVELLLTFNDDSDTFGKSAEQRCAPAGPCAPGAAAGRVQFAVRYLPGAGAAPSAALLTTVGATIRGEAGAGGAPIDDDDSFIYGGFPSRISRATLRRGWSIDVYAFKGSTAKVTLTMGRTVIAGGRTKAKRTGRTRVRVKATRAGLRLLRRRTRTSANLTIAASARQSGPVTLFGR